MTSTTDPVPFVCDMSAAPDTPRERIAEYRRLFEHALAGRARTPRAVIWRFTARPGVDAWVRDLASREALCCPFLAYTVTAAGGEVVYAITAGDDPRLAPMLDLIERLPDEIAGRVPGLLSRLDQVGLEIRTRDGRLPARPAE
jgi:hypothetical protein